MQPNFELAAYFFERADTFEVLAAFTADDVAQGYAFAHVLAYRERECNRYRNLEASMMRIGG